MRIGIAGAGIGGLAAAALLARAGHEVTVVERFDRPRPVGSGLVIQPVGQAVLEALGALGPARALGRPIRRMAGHEARSGRPVLAVDYDRPGGPEVGLAIHRASLFHLLWEAARAAGVQVLAAAEIASAAAGWFGCADGRRVGPFDLLVDAAGAGSPLSPLRARALPYGALWANVPWPGGTDLPGDELRQCYRRAERMAGVLPIGTLPGGGRPMAAVFWSLRLTEAERWAKDGLDAWRHEATALWPAIALFAAQIRGPGEMTLARYAHGALARPWAPGIARIGDAAHRASPQLGQGANMALLDALALARALDGATGEAALRRYARARRLHVALYHAVSALFTPQYQSDSRILPWVRDRLLFPLSQVPPLPRALTALVCGRLVPPLRGLG